MPQLPHNTVINNRLPRPAFRSIKHINRTKALMLGLPVVYAGGHKPPFGYVVDEEDPKLFVPVQKDFEYLLEAKLYLRTSTYEDVAQWLSRKCISGDITATGLHKLMELRQPVKECLLPVEEKELL